jgi:predicted anti-sigma-YlaC factor YlaD
MDSRSSCERARYLAALAPDGVLSEFELRMLDAHAAGCPDCGAFASDVARIAETLRAEPLEQLQSCPRVVMPARRRRSMRRLAYFPTAAGLAVTVAVAAITTSRSGSESFVPNRPAIVIDAVSVEGQAEQAEFLRNLRDYRNAQIANESPLAKDRKPGFFSG